PLVRRAMGRVDAHDIEAGQEHLAQRLALTRRRSQCRHDLYPAFVIDAQGCTSRLRGLPQVRDGSKEPAHRRETFVDRRVPSLPGARHVGSGTDCRQMRSFVDKRETAATCLTVSCLLEERCMPAGFRLAIVIGMLPILLPLSGLAVRAQETPT